MSGSSSGASGRPLAGRLWVGENLFFSVAALPCQVERSVAVCLGLGKHAQPIEDDGAGRVEVWIAGGCVDRLVQRVERIAQAPASGKAARLGVLALDQHWRAAGCSSIHVG